MSLIWIDGAFRDEEDGIIPSGDSGLSNGIGVFDTLLSDNGALLHWRDHLARLRRDVETVIGPVDIPALENLPETIGELLERNGLQQGFARVRVTVTGGPLAAPLADAVHPATFITARRCPDPASLSPLHCAIVSDHPRHAGDALENCKRLDYSRSYAARRKARALGADDAILTNTRGHAACGTTANLFIEENGNLVTPPLSEGVLAGITRQTVLEAAHAHEDIITIERLFEADAVYLTNSLSGLRAVHTINGKTLKK